MTYDARPGMVRAVKADGTVGWVDMHEMIDMNVTEQLFRGQERMRIDSEGWLRIGVFGCKGDADDPSEYPGTEQPSLPLEEMEKAWGPEEVTTVKMRRPSAIDAGFFYCPYIPLLKPNKITFVHDGGPLIDPAAIEPFAKIYPIDAPIPKKRKVLSSR